MKKPLVFLIFLVVGTTAFAQNLSYQQKLYQTCKVWGFVKYHHSEVSVCKVNWDSVLMSTLPLMKNAVTNNDFNDVLHQMLLAAGSMKIATTSTHDTLPLELKRNLNLDWIYDVTFRSDVKDILDTIKNNFRPHSICWVKTDWGGSSGWLVFPFDDPIVNQNLSTAYPDEFTRLMIIFRYWNILNYFNPNKYILEKPWDSTLYNNVLSVAGASNYTEFFMTFRKMTANLNDAHTEGWTNAFLPWYMPKMVLRYARGQYFVVKSGYPQINKGDLIVSIDDKTSSQWEDSLAPFISAGNPGIFRNRMCSYMLRGDVNSPVKIEYQDSTGTVNTLSTYRYIKGPNDWHIWQANDTLASAKWKKWDCNVGYVHMGNLLPTEVDWMYGILGNTKAIIFDIRNYPNSTIGDIAKLIYPDRIGYVKYAIPDVTYPGTFEWNHQSLGYNGNSFYYEGKVIVLCNEETMSAAELSCMILKAMPNSVLVGSQTAGADGNVILINLSRDIRTGFSSLGVFYPDGTQTQRIGIVPDSVVYITPEGIRHGRDEVLEKALEIAGCDPTSGVNNLKLTINELHVFPNPASDHISISFSNMELSNAIITIFNAHGVEVKQFEQDEFSGRGDVRFSTEILPSGLYICCFENEKNKICRRFAVLR